MEELQKLIADMDVPQLRREDLHWLNRNLFIRNSLHPNFAEAVVIIRRLISEEDVKATRENLK